MSGGDGTGPLSIAVVIESFDPAAGGNERSTAQTIDELAKRGHRVTLITGCCAVADEPAGAAVRAMSRRRSSSVFRLMRFSRWAQRELAAGGFDTSLSVTMAVPAAVLQPRGGTVRETLNRNVAMRGGGWAGRKKAAEVALDPKQRLLLSLERRTLADPAVRRVVALSRYVVRQLDEHHAFPADRMTVIPNAAVMPTPPEDERQAWREAVRAEHGVIPGAGATLLLFAAQNPKLKGYATLLGALRRLRNAGADVAALLAGGFPTEIAEERSRLAKLGFSDIAPMLRPVGPTQSMVRLYAAADVTVLPSWYDPSSKVILESLMMSTPAISTAYNGASDHLEPPDGPPRGVVVADPADAEGLAAAVQRLMDPAFHASCIAACDGLAERLSMIRHIDALEQVLQESVRDKSRG
ncbi:MAG: glycosyltransferase family 4 protein [Planctomycetota bacterium]